VGLPDDWSRRWPGFDGVVWYRLSWDQPPTEPTAGLFLQYLNMAGAVSLNGSLLHEDPRRTEPLTRAWNTPRHWLLAAPLLRPGPNTLVIRVSGLGAYQPGLGEVAVGDAGAIEARFARERLLRRDLQLFSVAVTATLGAFFVPLWLMRRRETAFGWFGLMSLAAFLYELNQLVTTPWPFASNHGWAAFTSIAFLAYSACFTLFVLRFCERRFPRLEAAFWALMGACAVAMAAAPPADVALVRNVVALVPGLTYLASCLAFFWFCAKSRRTDQLLLAMCIAVFVLVGIHDFLVFFKVLDSNLYLGALTSPIQLVSMGMVLGWRFVASLRRIEGFNQELNASVAAAREELATTLHRQHELEVANVRLGERLNLAHDLHDGLGGTLVSSIATLEHAPERVPPARFLGILKELRDDLRIVVDAASSQQHAQAPLAEMIVPMRHRLTRLFEHQAIACRWHLSGVEHCFLPAPGSLDVMRILQEALTNVLKHSGAQRVDVTLDCLGERLRLVVADDGIGFDPAGSEGGPGAGLRSMRRRAHRLGGTFSVARAEGRTELVVELPLAPGEPK
jgi:signal transduction histidine kinase